LERKKKRNKEPGKVGWHEKGLLRMLPARISSFNEAELELVSPICHHSCSSLTSSSSDNSHYVLACSNMSVVEELVAKRIGSIPPFGEEARCSILCVNIPSSFLLPRIKNSE
jgi:hypothetical protein